MTIFSFNFVFPCESGSKLKINSCYSLVEYKRGRLGAANCGSLLVWPWIYTHYREQHCPPFIFSSLYYLYKQLFCVPSWTRLLFLSLQHYLHHALKPDHSVFFDSPSSFMNNSSDILMRSVGPAANH